MVEKTIRFDDSLPLLVSFVYKEMKLDPYAAGVFLRDGFGRVSLYLSKPAKLADLKLWNKSLSQALGPHASPQGALHNPDAAGASVLEEKSIRVVWEEIEEGRGPIRLVERRFFGQDWLATPRAPKAGLPPILTFGSLKGGVGRTTALFVLAMELSRRGKNILVVDLDLEAPGLASLILRDDERPKYGAIDYLVERGLGGTPDADLHLFVETSRLTDRHFEQGRVDLIPATGIASQLRPANMLAKLSRALLETPGKNGPLSLSGQVLEMIERFAALKQYDAIMIDSRAGLAELSAAPLLSLGAHVALFGTDSPHTFEGFKYLLAHLSTLPVNRDQDWREQVFFVQSKADVRTSKREMFDDKLYEVLSENFYEKDDGESVFNYSFDDAQAPHKPCRIFFDPVYMDVDPLDDPLVMEELAYRSAFGDFIETAIRRLGLHESHNE